jgi:hypothetical protein
MMDKLALGQAFLPVPGFSAIGLIPPKFHTHLHIHVGLTRRAIGLSFETVQKKKAKLFLRRGVTG